MQGSRSEFEMPHVGEYGRDRNRRTMKNARLAMQRPPDAPAWLTAKGIAMSQFVRGFTAAPDRLWSADPETRQFGRQAMRRQ